MRKDTYIRIRLTEHEKKELREAADHDMMSMSGYILDLIHKEKMRKELNNKYGRTVSRI